MPRPRIILLDERPIRRTRLAEHLTATGRIELVTQAGSLPEVPRDFPDAAPCVLAVSQEMSQRAGFAEFAAQLEASGRRVVPYPAEPGAVRNGTGGAPVDRLRMLADAIIETALSTPRLRGAIAGIERSADRANAATVPPLVCIGASTGGLPILQEILAAFPADAPPTVIVQHIRGTFSGSVAQRLDRQCRIAVSEAWGGAPPASRPRLPRPR